MININSDFKILTKIVNGDGQVLSPLSIDFEFVYTDISNKSIKYIISNKKGTQKNCKSLDDNLILIFQNHGFRNFKIKETRHFYIPDSDMQDTFYDLYYDNIIDFKTLSDKAIKVNKNWILQPRDQDIIVPYYKGEPGKSAYQYAKEGGYEGDEERFYKDLVVNVNSIDYINSKYLIIPYSFVSLEGSPSNEEILLALGMNIDQLKKMILNIKEGSYESCFIKGDNKTFAFNYSLTFNSNTSWTLKIEYREENIVNKRTLQLSQDTLIYNANNIPLSTTMFSIQNFYTKPEIDKSLEGKVDKEVNKFLSSNDFTNEYKQKLDSLSNYNDEQIKASISQNTKEISSLKEKDKSLQSSIELKVDKVQGKVLSSNDYTNEEKQKVNTIQNKQDNLVSGKNIKTINGQSLLGSGDVTIEISGQDVDLSGYYTKTKTDELLGNKVDKVVGKKLTTEDFTTEEKEKLSGLKNYDDSVLRTMIDGKATKVDVYTKSEADEKFNTKVDKISGKSLSTNDFTNEYKQKLDQLSVEPSPNTEYFVEFPEEWIAKESLTAEEIKQKYTSYDGIYNHFKKISKSVGVCVRSADPATGTITSITHNFLDDPGDSSIMLDEPGFIVAFQFLTDANIRVQMLSVPRSLDNSKITIAIMENKFVTSVDLTSYVTNKFFNEKLEAATKNLKMYPLPPEILGLSSPPTKSDLNSMFSKYSEYISFKSFIDKVSDGKPIFIDYKQRSIPWKSGYICGCEATSTTLNLYVNYGKTVDWIAITYDDPTNLGTIGYHKETSTLNFS